jgi:ribosomal protein L29
MKTTDEKKQEINWWKQKAEELRLQLHLGATEAAEAFEKQKRDIGEWAKSTGHKLSSDASEAEEKLKAKLEEIEVQAALGKAETREKIQEQRKAMSRMLSDAKHEAEYLARDTKEEAKIIGKKASEKLDQWHTRLDLVKLQLHLGAKEASEEWNERKSDLKAMISDIESKLEDVTEETMESWGDFKTDVSKAWNRFRDKLS